MNRQPVALQQLAEQAAVAVTRLDTGFDSDRISISGDFPVVEGDACLLKQVFVNLVGNAVKFSLPASTIEIRAFRRPGSVCVQVADRGIGFDHSVAERLFEPFYRVHSRERGGHGLGLSIVRRIIERHGGCVYARPRPGGGALFEFSLQLDATDTPALMATTLSEALSKPSTATHG